MEAGSISANLHIDNICFLIAVNTSHQVSANTLVDTNHQGLSTVIIHFYIHMS